MRSVWEHTGHFLACPTSESEKKNPNNFSLIILKVCTITSAKCYLIVFPTINLISLHILHLAISAPPAVPLCPVIGLYIAGIQTISVAKDREHMCTCACWEKRCASLNYLLNNACRLSPLQMFYLSGTLAHK